MYKTVRHKNAPPSPDPPGIFIAGAAGRRGRHSLSISVPRAMQLDGPDGIPATVHGLDAKKASPKRGVTRWMPACGGA